MVHKIFLFGLLLLVTGISACKKKKGDVAFFSIQNNSGTTDLNIAVYASEADYINGVNSVAQGKAPLDGEFKFYASDLKAGGLYYVDAYSSDHNYSNWMLGDSLFGGTIPISHRSFQYVGSITSFSIDTLPMTNAMHCLLDDTKGSTTWRAYDSRRIIDGAPVWDVMTDDERYVKIVIRKNNTATFYYVEATDTVTTSFTFGSLRDYPVFVLAPHETNVNFMMFNSFLDQITLDYRPPSIDSATVIMHERVYYITKG